MKHEKINLLLQFVCISRNFRACFESVLLPSLNPGSVVLLAYGKGTPWWFHARSVVMFFAADYEETTSSVPLLVNERSWIVTNHLPDVLRREPLLEEHLHIRPKALTGWRIEKLTCITAQNRPLWSHATNGSS